MNISVSGLAAYLHISCMGMAVSGLVANLYIVYVCK